MNEAEFLKSVEKCISVSSDTEHIAEDLALVDCSGAESFSKNGQVLARYISGFQFDWDNETYDNDENKLSETIDKIRQILADINAGNEYTSVFSTELAYSRLKDGEYEYEIINTKMDAKTAEDAEQESRDIRLKTDKAHPDDASFTLEDVRIREQIIDQKGNIVLNQLEP